MNSTICSMDMLITGHHKYMEVTWIFTINLVHCLPGGHCVLNVTARTAN